MFEQDDDQDRIETGEGEAPDGHPWRTTILPPMPTWMAEGKDPPESAIVRRRRPVRSVVFEFESVAADRDRGAVRRVA